VTVREHYYYGHCVGVGEDTRYVFVVHSSSNVSRIYCPFRSKAVHVTEHKITHNQLAAKLLHCGPVSQDDVLYRRGYVNDRVREELNEVYTHLPFMREYSVVIRADVDRSKDQPGEYEVYTYYPATGDRGPGRYAFNMLPGESQFLEQAECIQPYLHGYGHEFRKGPNR